MGDILDVCSQLSFGGCPDFIGKRNIWIEDTCQPEVLRLAERCERGQLSPEQLLDVVMDALLL